MLPIPPPPPISTAQSGAAGALASIQLISEQDDHTLGDVQQTNLSLPRSTPVRLSPSFPLILVKLVVKIQSLQYAELKEFLPDNLELMKRMEAVDRAAFSGLPPSLLPKMREVPSIAAWAYCFGQYVAVLAESHPHLVKDRLTYMCLILSEARKTGEGGGAITTHYSGNMQWRMNRNPHIRSYKWTGPGSRLHCMPHTWWGEGIEKDVSAGIVVAQTMRQSGVPWEH